MSNKPTIIDFPRKTPHFDTPPPLTLYVHIPWCVRKCPYCDFNSHEARGDIPEAAYLAALERDLEAALPQVWGRRIHSVFFGGGTPSLLSAAGLDKLLTLLRTLLPIEPLAEITLEANPGTFEAEKFRAFRAAGINRLSIGIQSFNRVHLQSLGRIHDATEARRAVEIGLAHFDHINLDLMYALPQQTLEQSLADIDCAIGFGVQHISAYHLTLEPNTLFHAQPPALPDNDAAAAMQCAIEARLNDAGYAHYETSAFAKKHHACQHNLNYWRFGDYLGIGAGAHSKLTTQQSVVRQMRYKQPQTYMQQAQTGQAIQEQHSVSAADLGFEFMMNALRLNAGFAPALFQAHTGLPLQTIERPLQAAEASGLLLRDLALIQPTKLGQRFLNDLLQLFLPEPV